MRSCRREETSQHLQASCFPHSRRRREAWASPSPRQRGETPRGAALPWDQAGEHSPVPCLGRGCPLPHPSVSSEAAPRHKFAANYTPSVFYSSSYTQRWSPTARCSSQPSLLCFVPPAPAVPFHTNRLFDNLLIQCSNFWMTLSSTINSHAQFGRHFYHQCL